MEVYELSSNASFEPEWTAAVSIHPTSHVILWKCPECGRMANYPGGSFDVTIEGGSKFPDLLPCGAFPFLIVSDRVLSSWRSCGVGAIVTYPIRVVNAVNTILSPNGAPTYFRVEVAGSIKVDIQRSGGAIQTFCLCCGEFETEPNLIKKFAFMDGSWDGNPIFRDERLFPRVIFCTDSVKGLVEKEGHTNFQFYEMLPFD